MREKLMVVGVKPAVLTQNSQPTDALLMLDVGNPLMDAPRPVTPPKNATAAVELTLPIVEEPL